MRSRDRASVEVCGRKAEAESDLPGEGIVRPPTYEEVQQRALEIRLERGGAHCYELDDWLEARRELLDECFGAQ